jgi:hypothetical protein
MIASVQNEGEGRGNLVRQETGRDMSEKHWSIMFFDVKYAGIWLCSGQKETKAVAGWLSRSTERDPEDISGSRTLVSNWWLVNSFLEPKTLVVQKSELVGQEFLSVYSET